MRAIGLWAATRGQMGTVVGLAGAGLGEQTCSVHKKHI